MRDRAESMQGPLRLSPRKLYRAARPFADRLPAAWLFMYNEPTYVVCLRSRHLLAE